MVRAASGDMIRLFEADRFLSDPRRTMPLFDQRHIVLAARRVNPFPHRAAITSFDEW